MARLSFVPISLLLLASLAAAASAAAADPEEGGIRIRVRYPTKEQSRWLDRWAEKHQAQRSGEGFKIRPATDEESAFLNRMSARGAEKTGGRAGYDGRIEFGDDHPFGRIVVDAFHLLAIILTSKIRACGLARRAAAKVVGMVVSCMCACM